MLVEGDIGLTPLVSTRYARLRASQRVASSWSPKGSKFERMVPETIRWIRFLTGEYGILTYTTTFKKE
jgi:hypothetical protein